MLIVGFGPVSPGTVTIGCNESSCLPVTFSEFISNLIKAFLTGRTDNGFNSLRPKILISQVYGVVSGM